MNNGCFVLAFGGMGLARGDFARLPSIFAGREATQCLQSAAAIVCMPTPRYESIVS